MAPGWNYFLAPKKSKFKSSLKKNFPKKGPQDSTDSAQPNNSSQQKTL
jgi:hypothetical protein